VTGTAEADRPCTAPGDAQRPPRPVHGFATEWCIDEEVPRTSESADAAPAPRP